MNLSVDRVEQNAGESGDRGGGRGGAWLAGAGLGPSCPWGSREGCPLGRGLSVFCVSFDTAIVGASFRQRPLVLSASLINAIFCSRGIKRRGQRVRIRDVKCPCSPGGVTGPLDRFAAPHPLPLPVAAGRWCAGKDQPHVQGREERARGHLQRLEALL